MKISIPSTIADNMKDTMDKLDRLDFNNAVSYADRFSDSKSFNFNYICALMTKLHRLSLQDRERFEKGELMNNPFLREIKRKTMPKEMDLFSCTASSYLLSDERRNFVVSDRFWKVLRGLNLDRIHVGNHLIPEENFSAYIKLPDEGVIEDSDGDKFQDFFVYIGKQSGFPKVLYNKNEKKWWRNRSHKKMMDKTVLSIATRCTNMGGNPYVMQFTTSLDKKDMNASLHQFFKDQEKVMTFCGKGVDHTYSWLPDILKILAYIFSGDPDLRAHRPEPSKKRSRKRRNSTAVDRAYELVGFGWEKEPIRCADSWDVAQHLRWQPYGPGKRKLKLIKVAAHKRSWKKPFMAA